MLGVASASPLTRYLSWSVPLGFTSFLRLLSFFLFCSFSRSLPNEYNPYTFQPLHFQTNGLKFSKPYVASLTPNHLPLHLQRTASPASPACLWVHMTVLARIWLAPQNFPCYPSCFFFFFASSAKLDVADQEAGLRGQGSQKWKEFGSWHVCMNTAPLECDMSKK